jgi:2-polyprenyl-6-methoxyphenol hydroxylase-like FAD-dependent oxidoreductase
MIFMDEQLNPKFARPIPPVAPGVAGFGINRLTLREILLSGVDGAVRFGKAVRHFEETGDGRVCVSFGDGSSVTGDLLVGADGTNSVVRRQLLPDAVVDEVGWAVYGRTPITAGMLSTVPDPLADTFNRVIGPDGAAVAVATCRTREPVGEAVARLARATRLTDVGDYFSWTVSPAGDRPKDADSAALHRLARDTVRGWHPAVRRIIDDADVAATFLVPITAARRVRPWPSEMVTLLGDALHTMSPGRGEGANTALRDADLLTRAITDVARGSATPANAKAWYEMAMLQVGVGEGFRCRAQRFAVPVGQVQHAGQVAAAAEDPVQVGAVEAGPVVVAGAFAGGDRQGDRGDVGVDRGEVRQQPQRVPFPGLG